MPALVISSSQLTSPSLHPDVITVMDPAAAVELLETVDIDRIVFDTRSQGESAANAIEQLIADLPVTTRLLAIVEQLPSSPICSDAGVVYLTPPVNAADIAWFVGSDEVVGEQ